MMNEAEKSDGWGPGGILKEVYSGDRIIIVTNEALQRTMRGFLEEGIKEHRPGFVLIGMSYREHTVTGYFINPAELTYVHIWRVRINPLDRIIYSDTWRELALVPIDGYRFRHDVILTKEIGELNKLGFDIPEPIVPLRLDGVVWQFLWAVKENLKDHWKAACQIIGPEKHDKALDIEVHQAYAQAMADLQEALDDY
jgi:hypothetical protein